MGIVFALDIDACQAVSSCQSSNSGGQLVPDVTELARMRCTVEKIGVHSGYTVNNQRGKTKSPAGEGWAKCLILLVRLPVSHNTMKN